MSEYPERILITGATGFVGRSLIEELSLRFPDAEIYAVARGVSVGRDYFAGMPNVQLLQADLLRTGLELPHAKFIVHAATPASAELNVADARQMFEANYLAMRNLLDAIESWPVRPRLLFTSSGAVYGDTPDGVTHLPEHWSGAILTSDRKAGYGEGKRVAEFLLNSASRDGIVHGVTARMFSFGGRYLPRDRHFAIGSFVRQAVQTNSIEIHGDGTPIRSYLGQTDMARWLVEILLCGSSTCAYHVGSEKPVTILQLAELVVRSVRDLLGKTVSIRVLDISQASLTNSRYVPSTQHTRRELKLEETESLEEIIESMILDEASPRTL